MAARQSQTTAARLARIERALEALVASPASSAPAKAKAASPATNGFVDFIHARAASKIACEIHASGCNRSFTPASSGRTNHEPRIIA